VLYKKGSLIKQIWEKKSGEEPGDAEPLKTQLSGIS